MNKVITYTRYRAEDPPHVMPTSTLRPDSQTIYPASITAFAMHRAETLMRSPLQTQSTHGDAFKHSVTSDTR